MIKHFKAGITGTGRALPERRLTNSELEKIVETSDEWIIKRTGISERRIIEEDMPLSHLASDAAKNAIKDARLDVLDIDLIIATTVTPDYLSPSLACSIQKDIGADNAAAFDMNAACTGFIYALKVAQGMILSEAYKNILIVSAEAMSRATDFTDRKTCVLFGDGAGAVIVSRVEDGSGIEKVNLGSIGKMGSVLTIPCLYMSEEDKSKRNEGSKQVVWMDGSEVFIFASRIMSEATSDILKETGTDINEIKYLFPHQANMRILQNAAKRLDMPMDRVYSNLSMTGNISSASIPVCLSEAYEKNMLQKGDKLILVAFGGGLTYGASLLTWSK
ncbi:MAG: ketoacyl-ACP synthase III [Clostridiaceae bacterium]|nr:ketoacyl-ACP synthase III [Clostridiaceae bacterium]